MTTPTTTPDVPVPAKLQVLSSRRIQEVMKGQKATGLIELWSKTKGELESRVFQDEDQFVLVIRRVQPGEPKRYVFWHPYPNLEAAKAQVPS